MLAPFGFALIAGAIALTLLSAWHPAQPAWLPIPVGAVHGFFEALSEAAAVGGAIGLLLETWAAHHLVRQASDEVATKVLGSHLPDGFRGKIREIVHETDIVLESWTTKFALQSVDEKTVRVVIDSTYTATNYGDAARDYQPIWAEEAVYSPEILLFGALHGQVTLESFEPGVEPGVITARGPVVRLKSRETCEVHWRSALRCPATYTLVMSFGLPTAGAVIECMDSAGFSFKASERQGSRTVASRWIYDEAFMTGQHLRVWWAPRININPTNG